MQGILIFVRILICVKFSGVTKRKDELNYVYIFHPLKINFRTIS